MTYLRYHASWAMTQCSLVALRSDLFAYASVRISGARPAIPSGPGSAARVPTMKHVGTCAATFRGSLLRRRPFLLECLPLKAVKRQEHSSQARKELITMTDALAFINQYIANVPHMRNYFVSLCPALNRVEAKNGSESSNSQKEKSHVATQ